MWKRLVGAFNQPGEGPSRGLLFDCENFADGSFAALVGLLSSVPRPVDD